MIKDKVHDLILDFLKIDINSITEDLGPGDIEEWDSLAHQGLILELEKAFEIKLDIDDILEMESVEEIVEIMTEKMKTWVVQNFVARIVSFGLDKTTYKKIAIQNSEIALTYSEFVKYILLSVSFLKNLGLKNEIVINALGNKIEFVILHYSSILLGATSTPLSNNLTIEKFKVYLSSLNTKIIFTDKKDFEISNYKIVNIEHFGDFINLISKFSSDKS